MYTRYMETHYSMHKSALTVLNSPTPSSWMMNACIQAGGKSNQGLGVHRHIVPKSVIRTQYQANNF